MIDEIDRTILQLLQEDARTPNAQIARTVGMAPSAVLERIRKLREQGVIRGYVADIDPRALDLGLVAFVFVRADEHPGSERSGELIAKVPGVLEVHHVAGEDCYLVKIRAADPEALGRVLRERFGAVPEIESTRTTIVLETLKETTRLPIQSEKKPEADLAG